MEEEEEEEVPVWPGAPVEEAGKGGLLGESSWR